MGINLGSADEEFVLQANDIVKEFSGVRVLDHVDFFLKKGEVHALLGENGAGKSTLMKILSGAYTKTSGHLYVRGNEVNFRNCQDASANGIGIVYQEFSQVPQLSITENLFLGKELYKKMPGGLKILDHKAMREEARKILNRFDLNLSVTTAVKTLGIASQQMLEICKALFENANILIFDEPTAALSESETEKLFDIIRGLKNDGVSIIYISHKLEEIKKICDRATIIRDGKNVATVDVSKCEVKQLISLMIGKDIKSVYQPKNTKYGEVLFELDNYSSPGKFQNVSFSVREGEIVGITGLVGAGKTEIARAIFGFDKKATGSLKVKGKNVRIRGSGDARANEIALIPEDRKRQGVILKHTAKDNILLPNLKTFRNKLRILRLNKGRLSSVEMMKNLDIRPMDPEKKLMFFSGGNQQKVVIAKWLMTNARILIFDEPTRGVDVGAKTEIYKLISELAKSGCGIIICSSEISEIKGLCNTIIVMKKGKVIAVSDDSENDIDILLKTQVGG